MIVPSSPTTRNAHAAIRDALEEDESDIAGRRPAANDRAAAAGDRRASGRDGGASADDRARRRDERNKSEE